MIKILKKFRIILVIIVAMIITNCEKPEPPKPDCEINNYGWVTVRNNTGYIIWVDVTWELPHKNYEKKLYDNGQYKYNNIPAGSIRIWVSFDNSYWKYDYEHLSSCEDLTFKWYYNSRKSTGCPFVLDIGNGVLVEPIKINIKY